MLHFRL